MTEEKTLDVTSIADAKEKVNDIKVVGNGDMFTLLCKASSKSQGWMKSTKAMQIPGAGCVVQVSTQQGDQVAEALTFVPDTIIAEDINGGNRLISIQADLEQRMGCVEKDINQIVNAINTLNDYIVKANHTPRDRD